MTTDQIKNYIEDRLRKLGWEIRIPKSGYDKIRQYANGKDERLDRLYYKLIFLGSKQPKRQITGNVVKHAIDELKRIDEIMSNAPAVIKLDSNTDYDSLSINELASVLEKNVVSEEEATAKEAQVSDVKQKRGNGAQTLEDVADGEAGDLPKILVVDDSPTIRTAVINALENVFAFIEASDGEEAWKLLRKNDEIKLVITDLLMPKMDGYDLIKRIRSDKNPPWLRDIPIIVVTALEDTNAKLKALVNGANDFITKSTDAFELQVRVITRYKLAQAIKELEQPDTSEQKAGTSAKPTPVITSIPTLKRPVASIAKQAARQNAQSGSMKGDGASAAKGEMGRAEGRPSGLYARINPEVTQPISSFFGWLGEHISGVYKKLSQLSPTTAITLGATGLVAIMITVVLFSNRSEPTSANKLVDIVRADSATETSVALDGINKPQPSEQTVPSKLQVSRSAPKTVVSSTPKQAAPVDQKKGTPAKPKEKTPPPQESLAKLESATMAKPAEPKPTSATQSPIPPQAKLEPKPETKPTVVKPVRTKPDTRARSVKAPTPSVKQRQASAPAVVAAPPVTPPPAPTKVRAKATDTSVALLDAKRANQGIATILPKTLSSKITRGELDTLLRKFAFMYEAGDTDQFLTLFDDNVRTNDRANKAGLRDDYEELFRTTNVRQMILGSVAWEVNDNQAYGWGNFEVKVRKYGEKEIKAYKGSLTFYVEKREGRIRIKRLYHGQWQARGG